LYRQGSDGSIKKIWELNRTKGEILPMTDITDKYGWDASMKVSLYDKIRQDMFKIEK